MSSARSSRWRSLGVRLTGWYFLVFLASTLLLATAASYRIRSSIREQIVATVTTNLTQHRQAFEAHGIDGLKELTAAPERSHQPLYVRVVDHANVALFEYRSNPALSFDDAVIAVRASSGGIRTVRARSDGSRWSFATAPLSAGRWLQLAISDEQTRVVVGHLRAGLVAVWMGAIVLGLLGGFLLTRRALRPARRLAATARQVIESGDLALRVPERGTRDELDELSHLFNGVLARNEALVRGMREALDNVAHDLRTPLTRLRTGAEVALRDAAEPQQIREALADALEESDRTLAMMKTLMDISEAETGVMKLERTPVDLSELAREAIDLYQHVADERGVRLLTHLAAIVSVNGDRNRLHQVVANLVDNAIKYTTAGGQVELTTTRVDPWASLTVKDSGVGIASADLPRIWERLYRADQSRSERGLGLGLSLVKAIVEAHGGQVEVRSEVGVGSTFIVRLPAG
jgi:signal transduction histidine kinase